MTFRSGITYHTVGNEHLVVQLLNVLSPMNRDAMLVERNVLAGSMYKIKFITIRIVKLGHCFGKPNVKARGPP